MLNNEFCFTNDVFVEYYTQVNDTTRHQGRYREAWNTIKGLKGREEVCRSTDGGKVVWKVVENVTDDHFTEVRKFEDKKFN